MPVLTLQTWVGLPKDMKRELVEAFTDDCVRILGCDRHAVSVIIQEIDKENWGAGGELCSERFPDKAGK